MAFLFSKASDGLKERYEFARSRIHRETIFVQVTLISIFLIGFLLRLTPFFKFDYVLNANDTFSQLRAAHVILGQGLYSFFQFANPKSWYPYSSGVLGVHYYVGTPLTAVIFYYITNFLGLNMPLEQAAFVIPGILGSLTVIVIYFLGKEIANKKVGLLAAFLLAMSPGHIQRSMAGFFDNEAVGVFLLLLTFYFFLKALRTESFFNTVFAGITLGFMMNSWGGSSFAVQLISVFALTLILIKRFSSRLFIAYSGTGTIALLIAEFVPENGVGKIFFSIDGLMILGMIGLMLLISFYKQNKEWINKIITSKNLEKLGYGLVGLGVVFFIINLFIPVIPLIQAKFVTVLLPFLRDNSPISKSVAEQLIVTWGSLFRNLFLIFFLLPVGLVYLYQKPTERNIFLLLFTLFGLYFGGSMVRIILILAPAAALIGAKAIDETLLPYALVFQEKFFLSKRKKLVSSSIGNEHVATAFVAILIILLLQFFQGVVTSQQVLAPASILLPTGGGTQLGDWQETMEWIIRNTDPNSAVIASWWDYGYWIGVETNRTTVVDGATTNTTQIGNIGAFFMSTPDIALKIAKYYDITHFVVLVAGQYASKGADNDLGKTQWMVKIAEKNSNLDDVVGDPINEKTFFNFQNGQYSSFTPAFYDSLIWGALTQNLDSTSYGGYSSYPLVSRSPSGVHQGFNSAYQLYTDNIYHMDFESTNHWLRVWSINWGNAEKLIGV
ncbi:MAG: STT3 domain-containing protein [Candidatus Thorarchaeota archaeon]